MSHSEPSRLDQLLDLLADEVAERLAARAAPAAAPQSEPVVEPDLPAGPAAPPEAEPESTPAPDRPAEAAVQAEEPPGLPPVLSHPAQLLRRLGWGLLLVVILINMPLNRHGTTLATSIPSSASLVIRNGLVVKEADKKEIYVYQDGPFRWISSLDAFQHYGYTWDDVHIVEPGFLSNFEIGTPIHVLLKCNASPHIYRLEDGLKRWIVDIPTLEAEGHVWEDVSFVSCEYLRALPDGETIPPGHGPAPQP